MLLFDRRQVRRQRDRAAARFDRHDFLFREVAERLLDRLCDTTRRYDLALDLGCHSGILSVASVALPDADRRIGRLIQAEMAPRLAQQAAANSAPTLCADEEFLPIAPDSLDLIVSSLSLHSVNDLPGALIQAQRALKPDGLLLTALLGARSLQELRDALLTAEAEVAGGASPRVAPFVEVRDAGGLMQRAGFALPVVDTDVIQVSYDHAFALMRDLRGMGMANALTQRSRRPTRRGVLLRAAELYQQRHGAPDGGVSATFEIVFMHGWKPGPGQQQPLRPGSAQTRLADALGTIEHAAGEKTGRK